MSYGQVLTGVMKEHHLTQGAVASMACVSGSQICKYTKETRKVPKDVMRSISSHTDSPELNIESANEVTGDAWVPLLNNVDLHHTAVAWKTREELMEAYEAVGIAPITKRRDQMSQEELQKVKDSLMEAVETITALVHYVMSLCKAYGFSWNAIWKELRLMLRNKKYMT